MYSKEELEVLEKVAKQIFGVSFKSLGYDDQDAVYCYAEENDLF